MNFWKDTSYPIILSCARGMVPQTVGELTRMGYAIVDATDNIAVVRGNMRDVMRLNLQLRTAHRVLVPLLRAECRHLRELYDAAYSIEWENLFDADGYFMVNSIVNNDTVRDTRMPSLKTKDAVADRMRNFCGGRPDSGHETHGAAVFLYWQGSEATFFIDTTGEPLSRRGYRKLPGAAPMQETLAAGCVLASGWDPATPFVLPMCGSGTPAIEAALIALNRAPGSFKSHFAFMALKGYRITIPGERAGTSVRQRFGASPEQIWKEMVLTAREQERKEGMPPIIATDISEEAIETAHMNAIAAGVAEHITFYECDFAETKMPPAPGVVFLNPEYGERLGADMDLEPVYSRIGDFFKQKCTGYTGCVFTGNMEMSRKIGLRSLKRIPFFNGPLDCRLIIFDLYEGTENP
ncbi:MAG: class I SAM-dependent RNA methyltransferase [Kiritimatiellaeota bacterium]|nr:class I SAM-dependent RNA methyltransferase [Kiritimatiellota bacterium]